MAPEQLAETRPYFFQVLKDRDSWVHDWALGGLTNSCRHEDGAPKDQLSTMKASEKQQLAGALAKAFLSRYSEPWRFLWKESSHRNLRKIGLPMDAAGAGGMGNSGAPDAATSTDAWYVSLMAMGPEARSAFPELVKGLKNEELRGQTIAILGEMGPDVAQSAIPDIMKSLMADDPSVREAILALGKMGPAAKGAIPSLRALLGPPQGSDLQELAADAIKRIEGK
jgi:hypothetical protein